MCDPVQLQPMTRLAFSYPARPESIREVRHLIVTEAQTLAFSSVAIDDIALAVSEALTNLVQYVPAGQIRGVCETYSARLVIRLEVERGASQFLHRRALPAGLSHSGRGIPLLHLLMPVIEVLQRADGVTELQLVKPVECAAGGERPAPAAG
jgi:anti-sigma regulatory factor (Ser/Thr protein kinase)